MGANLQTLELTADDFGGPRFEGCMDALCVTRPDAPARLHRGFLEAGCDVIETNTFQASRLRLEEWGLADRTYDINFAGAAIARRECDAWESQARSAALRRRRDRPDRLPAFFGRSDAVQHHASRRWSRRSTSRPAACSRAAQTC